MITGHLSVTKDGQAVGAMYPARWYFRKHEDEPTTEVAIRRSFAEDLYIVMPSFDVKDQSASFQIVINPLVNWIWAGFGIMALGTGIALLPETAFAFALAKVPAGAATATMLLLSFLLMTPGVVSAQHVENAQTVLTIPRTPLEREMYGSIICMCGTCGRKRVGECTCPLAAEMRNEITGLIKEGKTRDDIIQYYIAKYGSQEPLAEPIDKGFNRLAWLFPYAVGALGLVTIGFVAMRWSHHAKGVAESAAPPLDSEVASRLDDELRNLD
jgi:cytochrome c-type biogenesis protein CcmH/NrfF